MNLRMIKLLSVFALLAEFPLPLQAQEFEDVFRARDISQSLEGCKRLGSTLQKNLHESASLDHLETRCIFDATRYHLEVLYRGLEKLAVNRIDSGYPMSAGTYASISSCENDLEKFSKEYSSKTKTRVLLTYCGIEYSDDEDPFRYSLRLISLGRPNQQLFTESRRFLSPSEDSIASIKQELEEQFQQEDFKDRLVKIFTDKTNGKVKVVFSYYAKKKLALGFESFATYENTALCRGEKAKIKKILISGGVKVGTQICIDIGNGVNRLQSFIFAPRSIDVIKSEGTFATRSACEEELQSLVQSKRDEGIAVFGGFCTYTYDPILFRQPTFRAAIISERQP